MLEGDILSQRDMERMPSWIGTFRHIACIGQRAQHLVCLIRKPKGGYVWKMPGKPFAEECSLPRLQSSINHLRIQLVKGRLPRGVKMPKAKKKVVA